MNGLNHDMNELTYMHGQITNNVRIVNAKILWQGSDMGVCNHPCCLFPLNYNVLESVERGQGSG